MLSLPSFVRKQLYKKESLYNAAEGCQFTLHNPFGSGTITSLLGLKVDGESHAADALDVVPLDGLPRPGGSVTEAAPLAVGLGATLVIRLRGVRLGGGRHTLSLGLITRELGDLEIPFTDACRDTPAPDGAVSHPAVSGAPSARGQAAKAVRPLRIAMIGAGSTVFARQLMSDILCTPGLTRGTFVLVDIDAGRLELAHRIGEKMAEASGRAWTIEATGHREKALRGCHYVINSIEVAGLRNVRHDYDIPLKYGVDQCIGDTIGPGGIFKMLRTGPAWLEILRDIERLCPRAIVMNYTNPMSALTLLALRATRLRVLGLCHSVQNTAQQLAAYLEVPVEELTFRCAGINHLAWYVELTRKGEDMYPLLRERARDPEIYEADPIRFEVMKHFGAFVTESSGHLSEYLPYFRKRPALLQKYARGGYGGESGFYANNWPSWREGGDASIRDILDGRSPLTLQRSGEFASTIIEGIEGGTPRVIHGNVMNAGIIGNLPADGCIEAPILADAAGLQPQKFGPLPAQMAALDRAHMAVHELMAAAVLDADPEAARHALLLDPLTAAVCSPQEIGSMFDEMWQAELQDLGWFRK
jgi:alpha-galactosidase